jgi:Sec-independent protein translocase protein TatA
MSENSAVIMMVVLLLLGAKLLGDGLDGVASL